MTCLYLRQLFFLKTNPVLHSRGNNKANTFTMWRLLSIIIISVMLVACKKDTVASGFDNYFNKLLVCDSIKTHLNSGDNTVIVGKGKGYDLLFTSTGNSGQYGTVGSYERYTIPLEKMNFRYERPDKLYYWSLNSDMHEGDYYTVVSAAGKNVILHHLKIGTGEEMYYYYTAP